MALQASGFSAFAEQANKVPINPVLAETDNIPDEGTLNPNEKRDGEFAELGGMSETEKSMAKPEKLSDDGCVFNFSAAKYVMSETDASFEAFVERQGNADVAAEVVFKAIDILAVYGEDYTILDGSGNPLEKVNGTVIAPEQMKRFAAAQEFETPEKEKTEQSAGNGDMREMIPDGMLKSQEISVTVSGGSGSGVKAQRKCKKNKYIHGLNHVPDCVDGFSELMPEKQ